MRHEESAVQAERNLIPPKIVDEQVRAHESAKIRLSKRMRAVALYMQRNPESIAFISIVELARNAGVSSTSVFRFSQLLGYSSFAEMKMSYRESLRAKIRSMQ